MSRTIQNLARRFNLGFRLADHQQIDVTVVCIAFVPSNQRQYDFQMTCEVNQSDYWVILATEGFNLTLAARREGEDIAFDEDSPLEVVLRIKDEFLHKINEFNHLDAIADHLVDLHQGMAPCDLLSAENWYAISVSQSIKLPPELQGTGTLKMGYRTRWANLDQGDQEVIQVKARADQRTILDQEPILQIVTRSLTHNDQPLYQWEGDHVVSFPYQGKNGQWRCFVDARDEMYLCCFYSMLPQSVGVNQRTAIATFLTGLNYRLTVGSFEMDFEDGEVRLRTSIDVEGDRLSEALFRRLMIANVTVMDRYLPELLRRID